MPKCRKEYGNRCATAFDLRRVSGKYKRCLRARLIEVLRTGPSYAQSGMSSTVSKHALRQGIVRAIESRSNDTRAFADYLPDHQPTWLMLPQNDDAFIATLVGLVASAEHECVQPLELPRWELDVLAEILAGTSFDDMVAADSRSDRWGTTRYGFQIEGDTPVVDLEAPKELDPLYVVDCEPTHGARMDLGHEKAASLLDELQYELKEGFSEGEVFDVKKFMRAQRQITGRVVVYGSTLKGVVSKIVAPRSQLVNRCVEMKQLQTLCIALTGRRAADLLNDRRNINDIIVPPAYRKSLNDAERSATPVAAQKEDDGMVVEVLPFEETPTLLRNRVLPLKPKEIFIAAMEVSDVLRDRPLVSEIMALPGIKEVRIMCMNPESELIPHICAHYNLSADGLRAKLRENVKLLRRLEQQHPPSNRAGGLPKLQIRLTDSVVGRNVFMDIDKSQKQSFVVANPPRTPSYKGHWMVSRNAEGSVAASFYNHDRELWQGALVVENFEATVRIDDAVSAGGEV